MRQCAIFVSLFQFLFLFVGSYLASVCVSYFIFCCFSMQMISIRNSCSHSFFYGFFRHFFFRD